MDRIELRANGLEFAALEGGDGNRTALLLHGFPDSPHSMVPVGRRLIESGYRVVAPWMRGYGPSELPPDGNYYLAALAADVIGLLDSLGWERSLVVGHDWGGLATYAACNLAPQRIDRAVGLSVPPLGLFLRNALRHPKQLLRSWYVFAIQLPLLPEWWLSRNDFRRLESLWRGAWSAPEGPPHEAHLERVKETFRRPGSLHAALGYYRALLPRDLSEASEFRESLELAVERVKRPTLMVTGDRDPAVGLSTFRDADEAFQADWELEVLADAGHFIQLERPERVARSIAEFGRAP